VHSTQAKGKFHNQDAPSVVERIERAHYLLDQVRCCVRHGDACRSTANLVAAFCPQGDLHGSAEQVNLMLAEHKDSAVVEVLGGWLQRARARCLVSQAVQILQARAATVAETLV